MAGLGMLRGFGGGAFSPDEDGVPAIARKPATPFGWKTAADWKPGLGMLRPVPEPAAPSPALAPWKAGPGMLRGGMQPGMTPDDIDGRRKMARGMIQEGMSSAPVGHWTQGAARVLQGLSGNAWMDEANQAEKDGMAASAAAYEGALNGGNPRKVVLGMLRNPATAPQGQKLANGMLAQDIENASPDAQLARDYKRAQIEKVRRDMTKPFGGNAPSNVQEWEYYNRLSPEDQQRYLTMKRAEKYLDTGTEFVRPNPVAPGENVSTVPKNVAEAAKQKKIGEGLGQGQLGLGKAEVALKDYEIKNNLVMDDIDRALAQAGPWTTGFVGNISSFVAGTPAHNLAKTLDGIKSNLGFDTLQQMRENSPTGGALGSVTERELELLQATWGSLVQSQTEEQFRYHLNRLKQIKREYALLKREAYQRDMERFGAAAVPYPDGGGAVLQGRGSQPFVSGPAPGHVVPTPQAIEHLRSDQSPEAVREFDEIFGAGAAQRALGGR